MLILCMQVRGRTAAMGATHTNDLVNIAEFYQQQILPDLQAPGDEVRRDLCYGRVGVECMTRVKDCLVGCVCDSARPG